MRVELLLARTLEQLFFFNFPLTGWRRLRLLSSDFCSTIFTTGIIKRLKAQYHNTLMRVGLYLTTTGIYLEFKSRPKSALLV